MGNQIYSPFNYSPTEPRGSGMAVGMDDAIRDMLVERQQKQVLQDMLLQHQQQQAELQRYQGMTPGEVSKSQLEGAQADTSRQMPGYLEQMSRGNMGRALSEQAKGTYDAGVNPSRIQADTAGNNLKAYTDRLMQLHGMMGAGNNLGAQAEWNNIRTGMPQEMQDSMGPYANPATVDAAIERLSRTPTNRGAERLAQIPAEAHKYGADQQLKGTMYSADQRLSAAYLRLPNETRAKLENVLAEIAIKLQKGTATQNDMQTASYIQQIMYNQRAAGSATTVDPNMIMWMMMNGGFGQGQQAPRKDVPAPVPAPGQQFAPGTPQNPIKLK